jgi:hypothetical protein
MAIQDGEKAIQQDSFWLWVAVKPPQGISIQLRIIAISLILEPIVYQQRLLAQLVQSLCQNTPTKVIFRCSQANRRGIP